jgi:predicted PurR-regulated permease PerM
MHVSGLLGKIYHAKWLLIGVALVLLVFWLTRAFLDVFVYGIFVYYISRPIKRRLDRYIKNETLLVTACLTLLVLPLIIGSKVDIQPATALLVLIGGVAAFGFIGFFIGIPIYCAAKIGVNYIIKVRREQRLEEKSRRDRTPILQPEENG